MAKKRLTPQDRIALDNWNELVASVREHSDINPTDTETEIRQRRERLEKNDEEWFKYYFDHVLHLRVRRLPQKSHRAADEEQPLVRGKGLVTRAGEIRTLHDGDIQTGTDKKRYATCC